MEVDIAELGEDQGVDGDDGQGDEVDHQQGQIFARDHLGGGDGQGVEQLVGLLFALLGDNTHGQDGHDDHEHNAAEAEHVLKVAHRGLQVVQHGADAHDGQQKGAEHVGGEGVEIVPQFMFQYRCHT